MFTQSARKAKAFKGVGMEGPIASWYARNTASALPDMRRTAGEIAAALDAGDWVLEVAPGPGYLAVELARLGLTVSAVDISRAFVRIGSQTYGQGEGRSKKEAEQQAAEAAWTAITSGQAGAGAS